MVNDTPAGVEDEDAIDDRGSPGLQLVFVAAASPDHHDSVTPVKFGGKFTHQASIHRSR